MFLATVIALLAVAPAAQADEIGGSGFAVPQDEWLWGIEGLVRTPVDLSGEIGVVWAGYDVDSTAAFDNVGGGGGHVTRAKKSLYIDPVEFEGGFRVSGGIGYWSCCVLIEPALQFHANKAYGRDAREDTDKIYDPTPPFGTRNVLAELELNGGWDLAFGPKMTWMIRDDTPVVGTYLGGLPLVFFPFMGISHSDYDVSIEWNESFAGNAGTHRADFEDDIFMIGFDLDIPLPGKVGPFTHALTFGFRWVDDGGTHEFGPLSKDGGGPFYTPSNFDGSPSRCAAPPNQTGDSECFKFQDQDGWRIGLYYRVTWNDFEGFFKRQLFGPAN